MSYAVIFKVKWVMQKIVSLLLYVLCQVIIELTLIFSLQLKNIDISLVFFYDTLKWKTFLIQLLKAHCPRTSMVSTLYPSKVTMILMYTILILGTSIIHLTNLYTPPSGLKLCRKQHESIVLLLLLLLKIPHITP